MKTWRIAPLTREEYFTYIYNQRSRTLRWLRDQGVPLTEAEIMVDKGLESLITAFDRTGEEQRSLIREMGYLVRNWKKKVGYGEPTGHCRVPISVETAERINERHGRVLPHSTDE